jgi:hypothetical protein
MLFLKEEKADVQILLIFNMLEFDIYNIWGSVEVIMRIAVECGAV